MAMMSTQEASAEFGKLLESGYYQHDRSANTAEDYSERKEKRDRDAALAYANSEEFKTLCAEEGLANG